MLNALRGQARGTRDRPQCAGPAIASATSAATPSPRHLVQQLLDDLHRHGLRQPPLAPVVAAVALDVRVHLDGAGRMLRRQLEQRRGDGLLRAPGAPGREAGWHGALNHVPGALTPDRSQLQCSSLAPHVRGTQAHLLCCAAPACGITGKPLLLRTAACLHAPCCWHQMAQAKQRTLQRIVPAALQPPCSHVPALPAQIAATHQPLQHVRSP